MLDVEEQAVIKVFKPTMDDSLTAKLRKRSECWRGVRNGRGLPTQRPNLEAIFARKARLYIFWFGSITGVVQESISEDREASADALTYTGELSVSITSFPQLVTLAGEPMQDISKTQVKYNHNVWYGLDRRQKSFGLM